MAELHRSPSRSRAVAVLAAACVIAALTAAAPASATTPGRNGRVAFKRYLDAERTTGVIFTVGPDGRQVRQITHPPAGVVDDQPDWAPNGSLIAFTRCAPPPATR